MASVVEGEKRVFMTGNEVAAWAAVAAGAEMMFGYPITPQNEIMHYWTRLAPKYNLSSCRPRMRFRRDLPPAGRFSAAARPLPPPRARAM